MSYKQRTLTYLTILTALALVLAACGGQAVAADPPTETSGTDTITVTGSGSARGNPDIANVSLGVNVSNRQISEAVAESNRTIEAITRALVALGVTEANIQTSNFNIWPEEVYDRETGQTTGERIYHVDSTVQILIESTDMVGEVLETAIQNGANNVYGLNFSIQDSSELASQARSAAIGNARERAEQLAAELGVELGRVVRVTEVSGGQIIPIAEMARGMGGGGGEPPISEGQLAVTIMVETSFEIVR